MTEFDILWKLARSRGTFQQEYMELKHIYEIMQSCECQSYLEVGTAEGNSLYILGHATEDVSYIDIDEDHTRAARADAIQQLSKQVNAYHGDSRDPKTHPIDKRYDCVLIDGGHDFNTAYSDSVVYGALADKYIFWHDVQLPEVRRAVQEYMAKYKPGKYTTFINSGSFGFGICKVEK